MNCLAYIISLRVKRCHFTLLAKSRICKHAFVEVPLCSFWQPVNDGGVVSAFFCQVCRGVIVVWLLELLTYPRRPMCLKILMVSQLLLAAIGWFDLQRLGGIDLVGHSLAYRVVWNGCSSML